MAVPNRLGEINRVYLHIILNLRIYGAKWPPESLKTRKMSSKKRPCFISGFTKHYLNSCRK